MSEFPGGPAAFFLIGAVLWFILALIWGRWAADTDDIPDTAFAEASHCVVLFTFLLLLSGSGLMLTIGLFELFSAG